MIKRTMIIIILFVMFMGFAFAVDADHTIVPGVNVGPVYMNRPITDDIYKILGKPYAIKPDPNQKNHNTYFWNDLIVSTNNNNGNNIIDNIIVLKPSYETAQGVKIGMNYEDFKSAMNNIKYQVISDTDKAIVCLYNNTVFIFDKNSKLLTNLLIKPLVQY